MHLCFVLLSCSWCYLLLDLIPLLLILFLIIGRFVFCENHAVILAIFLLDVFLHDDVFTRLNDYTLADSFIRLSVIVLLLGNRSVRVSCAYGWQLALLASMEG